MPSDQAYLFATHIYFKLRLGSCPLFCNHDVNQFSTPVRGMIDKRVALRDGRKIIERLAATAPRLHQMFGRRTRSLDQRLHHCLRRSVGC